MRRISIDDGFAASRHSADYALFLRVRGIPHVRACGIALDQIVNRASEDERRGVMPDPRSPLYGGDLDHAKLQARDLRAAADSVDMMIKLVERQFPANKPVEEAIA